MQPFLGVQAVSFCGVSGAKVWHNQSPDVLSSTFPVISIQRKQKEKYVRRHAVATHKSTHHLDRNNLPARWLP